jgi:hypothetical protein
MRPVVEDHMRDAIVTLPPEIAELLAALPPRVPRKRAAELVTRYYFTAHYRTLERWPLPWRVINGRVHCETRDLFTLAQRVLDEAPAIRSGKAQQAA